MVESLRSAFASLMSEGGLLRVRAVLALGLTGFGGTYLITNEAMPPGEFNVLWAAAISYYYGTRGGK